MGGTWAEGHHCPHSPAVGDLGRALGTCAHSLPALLFCLQGLTDTLSSPSHLPHYLSASVSSSHSVSHLSHLPSIFISLLSESHCLHRLVMEDLS